MLGSNTPVFLDDKSGFDEKQTELINLLVRTARRTFESKAIQKQEGKPKVEVFASTIYPSIISDVRHYKYLNQVCISFVTLAQNPHLSVGMDLPLFESPYYAILSLAGGNPDGTVDIKRYFAMLPPERSSSGDYLYKMRCVETLPLDSSGNEVQFTAFLQGVAYGV